jgi:hypothetical protein
MVECYHGILMSAVCRGGEYLVEMHPDEHSVQTLCNTIDFDVTYMFGVMN